LKFVRAPRQVQPANPLRPGQKLPDKPFTSSSDYYIAGDTVVTEEGIMAALSAEDAAGIRHLEDLMAGVTPTIDRFRINGVWTAERKLLHRDIVRKVILGFDEKTLAVDRSNILSNGLHKAKTASDVAPVYTVLGGRSGAGKSFLTSGKGPVTARNTLIMDSDGIKTLLPEWQGWNAGELHLESSYLFDEITKIARRMNFNVVHDMTLKNARQAVERMNLFSDAGYQLEGYYMYLPRHEAANRAVARALGEESRFVPLDILLNNTQNEIVFDQLRGSFRKWGMWDNLVPFGTDPKFVGGSL
jgi:predicted ABC-type ATPase